MSEMTNIVHDQFWNHSNFQQCITSSQNFTFYKMIHRSYLKKTYTFEQ